MGKKQVNPDPTLEPLVLTVCIDRASGAYFIVTSSNAATQASDLRLLGGVVLDLSKKFTEARITLAQQGTAQSTGPAPGR